MTANFLRRAFLALLGLLVSASALAAPGDLDPTFGVGGLVRPTIGASDDEIRATVLQPDGKLLVAGVSNSLTFNSAVVLRYNPDGSLDAGFGAGGIVAIALGTAGFDAIALQADDKIVLASSGGASGTWSVTRLLPSGAPDPTFGTEGKATLAALPSSDANVRALAIQPNGRILIAGGASEFYVRRIHGDGQPDFAFGAAGTATSTLPGSKSASSMSLLADGRILVAGTSSVSGANDFMVVRFNANGTLDTAFGGGTGYALATVSGPSDDRANALAVQSDGAILVGGSANGLFALMRFTAEGAVDTNFGANGRAPTPIGTTSHVRAITLQADGKIVAAGDTGIFSQQKLYFARYLANGMVDTSFGTQGLSTLTIGPSYTTLSGLALQADGRVIGTGSRYLDGSTRDFVLARLNTDGSPHATFGTAGVLITRDVLHGSARVRAIQALPNGRIVAAADAPAQDIGLVALTPGGALDAAFATAGRAIVPFTMQEFARALVLQPDGKLVVGGTSGGRFAVARYESGGALDTTFGSGTGMATYSTSGGSQDELGAIAVQSDGKIVAGGSRAPTADRKFALVRFLPNGSIDPAFANGTQTPPFGSVYEHINAVAAQTDGKIVAAGFEFFNSSTTFAVVRYTAAGALDATFGFQGRISGFMNGQVNAMAILPDGRILVAGTAKPPLETRSDFALARFMPDGTPDASFGNGGKVWIRNGLADSKISAIALHDGKIFVTGEATFGPNSTQQAVILMRLLENGTLDASFGAGGHVETFFPGSYAYATSIAIQADSHVLVGGYSFEFSGMGDPGAFVARYLNPDSRPNAFGFVPRAHRLRSVTAVSDPVTIAGINLPTPISVIGGQYSINCTGVFVAAPGTINAGQSVCVRHTTAATLGASVTTTLSVGGVLGSFTTTTQTTTDIFAVPALFAMQQYRDFLGREGDEGGIEFYAQALTAGTMSQSELIENFLASPEFQNGLPQCTRLYFSFFNRIPDYAGLVFQVGQYRAGVPLAVIAQNFFNAPEFTDTYGTLTDEEYVDLVYQNVLGRAPDVDGRAYYLERLGDGRLTRGQMMVGFSESPEFQALTEAEVYVVSVYLGMLRRTPEPAGLDFYVDLLTQGLTRNALITGFLNSPEYHGRFVP